jgi:hypothetical protein
MRKPYSSYGSWMQFALHVRLINTLSAALGSTVASLFVQTIEG